MELQIPTNRLMKTFNKNNPFINPSMESSTIRKTTDSINEKPPIPPRNRNTFKHQQSSSTTEWETFD